MPKLYLSRMLFISITLSLGLITCSAPQQPSPRMTGNPNTTTQVQPLITVTPSRTPLTTAQEYASPPVSTATLSLDQSPSSTFQYLPSTITATILFISPSPATMLPTSPTVAILPGHFLLRRPVAPPGNDWIEASYRYGSTQKGAREIHHGVEMENFLGTPVLASAEGSVIVAGNDQEIAYGPKKNFYGQLVILKHDFPELDQPLYTLYAHLSQVSVKVGQTVKTGQMLGLVGMTGWAIGYHLHFEIRLGENSYDNTRNPELWLQSPLDKTGQLTGAIAGRIVDRNGQPMRVAKVVITPASAPSKGNRIFVETYDDQSMARTDLTIQEPPEDYALVPYTHQTLGRDDLYHEDFAISNLPAGKYLFSFTIQKLYSLEIEIHPGQLTFITFPLNED